MENKGYAKFGGGGGGGAQKVNKEVVQVACNPSKQVKTFLLFCTSHGKLQVNQTRKLPLENDLC